MIRCKAAFWPTLIFTFFFSFQSEAKLLDKVLAVIDDKVITLSEAERVKENLVARKNISPQIYGSTKLSNKQIVDILLNSQLIRDRLSELGYVITDEQVESQIQSTEQRLGLDRDALLEFLRANNITFEEYFELIRQTIEFNIFTSRVIRPLISITEQEIKNEFYRENVNNKTLNFLYTLVDFTIDKSKIRPGMLGSLKKVLERFRVEGVLPEEYSGIDTNVLGDISEEGLTKDLQDMLKRTDEGSFTEPILIGNTYHVFFVKRKDLVESQLFLEAKDRIRNKIFERISEQITRLWYQREANKHYIKYFF